jgi:amidase
VDDLISSSATALAQAIRAKEVSSEEVVEAHLRRIEAVNPRLNAVVQLAADSGSARAQAREADAALARGEIRGPLHGVPFTVKDWLETAGLICAAGFPERADFVPKQDATVVARMRAAGAVLVGKTNALLMDPTGGGAADNPVYGHTNNPYDLSRTPGYSSGGEAAIIADCGSPLGLGSDSGGSIRIPAHFCGIAGLRPTTGRVPSTGHFPRIGALSDPRTQIGPMARFVEDLALTLPIIAGVDWRDSSVVPMPLGDPSAVDIAGLRVALYTDDGIASPTPDTIEAVMAASGALTEAGLIVEETRPRRIEETYEITLSYWRRRHLTGEEIDRSLFEWDRFRRAMLSFMESYDVILCPVCERPAMPHDATGDRAARDVSYTLTYSLTGWPCVVVRAGTSPEGLPIGVQIVARPWREDVALAVAQHIETALGGWQPPPAGRSPAPASR